MASYPLAERATPVNATSARACIHCNQPLVTSAWDRMNGFLVECPHCHFNHGKRWSIRAIALASILLNALSFFFTMRPARAAVTVAGWCAAFWVLLPRLDSAPESLQLLVMGALVLGPLLLNMALLVRHQVHLERRTASLRTV